ncbi:hypothetical protein LWI29_026747 [Acer saccharum]|uniref:Uncharacterized protein n=1 Tax=Acer saccharum TaxID=4024 RepID=A0AA39SWB0_ACESA|nr:hypothetical protein LWI29_026747 [Acer saccharum]
MVFDTEVATRVEEQKRGREEQRTHTRRGKLETDYGEITKAANSTIRKFQKGFKEDVCFLTQEFRNLRTFVEHELQAVHAEVDDVCTEWDSYKSSPTVGFGATSSTSTLSAIQVPKPATYNGTRNAIEVKNFLFGLEQYFEAKGA